VETNEEAGAVQFKAKSKFMVLKVRCGCGKTWNGRLDRMIRLQGCMGARRNGWGEAV
jgi:hypothetical protein